MMIQQVSVFLENRSGQLAKLTELLAENGMNLRAINLAETSDYGIVRLIVSEPEAAAALLLKNDIPATLTPVVVSCVPDKPGGLNALLQLLGEKEINVSYMYSVFGYEQGKAKMAFRVDDPQMLETVLRQAGYEVEFENGFGL